MYGILHQMLNMTLAASVLIAVICVYRLLFKKAPKWITCLLWGVAGLRLVLPFSWQSAVGLLPERNVISYGGTVHTGIAGVDTVAAAVQSNVIAPVVHTAAQNAGMTSRNLVTSLLFGVWIAGIGVTVIFALVSYFSVYKQVKISVKSEGVYLCDRVSTPFILGFIKPKIYVPSAMEPKNLPAVIAHEQAHIKRKDHWWKPLGYLILSVYWFNPLVWLGYILLCRDIEGACDEKVIKNMTGAEIADYSQALLNCSKPKKSLAVCPLAFGETGVKHRIQSALSYKKPAWWILIVALLASVAVGVCFTTKRNGGTPIIYTTEEESIFTAVKETYCKGDRGGECQTVGYALLGVEETQTLKKIYANISFGSFGFENGYFTLISGGSNPVVITVDKQTGEWVLDAPRDGSYYGKDIDKLFPKQYRKSALNPSEEMNQAIWEMQKSQAEEYLAFINRREAEVVPFSR